MDDVLEREGLPLVGEEVPPELAREVAQEGDEFVAPDTRAWVLEDRNRQGALTLEGAVERKKRIDAFEQVFENLGATQELAGFRIPGTGDPGEDCAEWFPGGFCEDCGFVALARGTCRRAGCPRCEGRWRFARVESILRRLLSFKYEMRAAGERERVLHCVVSPPDDWSGSVSELHREARELARKKDLHGAVELFHPYRLERALDASECPTYVDGGVERPNCGECPASSGCPYAELKVRASGVLDWVPGEFGMWRALQKLIQEGEAELEDYAYWSPHIHLIGVSKWTKAAEQGGAMTWRVVGELEEAEDLLKCAMYLLSHVGLEVVEEGRRAPSVRWSGSLASSNWVFDPVPEEEVEARVEMAEDPSFDGDDDPSDPEAVRRTYERMSWPSRPVRYAVERKVEELLGKRAEKEDGAPQEFLDECPECEDGRLRKLWECDIARMDAEVERVFIKEVVSKTLKVGNSVLTF